jgi:hypothetical protein
MALTLNKRKARMPLDELTSNSGSSSGDEANSDGTYRDSESPISDGSPNDGSLSLSEGEEDDASNESHSKSRSDGDTSSNESESGSRAQSHGRSVEPSYSQDGTEDEEDDEDDEDGSSVSGGDVKKLQPDDWSEANCKFEPKKDENGHLVYSKAFINGVPMKGSSGFKGIALADSRAGNGTHVRGRYTDPVTKERVSIDDSRRLNTNGGILECAKISDDHFDERFRQTKDDRYLALKHFETIGGEQVHARRRIRLRRSFTRPDTDVRIRHSRTGSTA